MPTLVEIEEEYFAYRKKVEAENAARAERESYVRQGLLDSESQAPPSAYFEDPQAFNAAQVDKPSAYSQADDEIMKEKEQTSLGFNMDTLTFLASPLMAFGDAVIAPMALQANTGSFLGDVSAGAKVSFGAFSKALFPEFGRERPEYGKLAAQQFGIDEKWGTALEIVTDPTILMGLGAAKVFQKGLSTVAKTAKGATQLDKAGKAIKVAAPKSVTEAGPWRRGLEEVLGASRPASAVDAGAKAKGATVTEDQADRIGKEFATAEEPPVTKLKEGEEAVEEVLDLDAVDLNNLTPSNVSEIVKRADLGDRKATELITNLIDRSVNVNKGAAALDAMDEVDLLNRAKERYGDFDGPEIDLGDALPVADELLEESVNANVNTLGGRINLARSQTDDKGGNNIIRRMEEIFSDQFDRITNTVSNADTVRASQRVQLRDVLGTPVAALAPKQAYVLRQSLVASADHLYEMARRTTSEYADDADQLNFDKALAFHKVLQAKAQGAATHARRLLQSYNISATTNKGRLKQVENLIEDSRLANGSILC